MSNQTPSNDAFLANPAELPSGTPQGQQLSLGVTAGAAQNASTNMSTNTNNQTDTTPHNTNQTQQTASQNQAKPKIEGNVTNNHLGSNEDTHFGFETVNKAEKQAKVADVFHSVASKYDLMNDLMSFGIHRLWKRFAIGLSGVRSGQQVLDIAGGTGDLAKVFSREVGSTGRVVLSDINESMLSVGRDRLIDAGCNNVDYILANAEDLSPFEDNRFDLVTISFGLRNVTDKDAALRSMYRVLKPGGRLLILEFSKPVFEPLSKLYDFYSFTALPAMGQLVTGDADSYKYLAESIRMHPSQQTLKNMMENAGFTQCDYHNLTGGIVALHRGFKVA